MTETARPVCAAHVASRGPRFFRTEEGVKFEITLDHRSKIGPRAATEADSLQYPAAWKAFTDFELDKAEERKRIQEEEERKALERIGKPEDVPEAKAEAERQAAERRQRMDDKRIEGQRREDAKRSGGL